MKNIELKKPENNNFFEVSISMTALTQEIERGKSNSSPSNDSSWKSESLGTTIE